MDFKTALKSEPLVVDGTSKRAFRHMDMLIFQVRRLNLQAHEWFYELANLIENVRYARKTCILLMYTVILGASFTLAFLLHFEFRLPIDQLEILQHHILWFVPFKLVILLTVGQCAGLLSFFSIPDLRRLVLGLGFSSFVMVAIWYYMGGSATPPRGVIAADFLLALLGLATVRLVFRLIREGVRTTSPRDQHNVRRVGIIGAGYVGAALARELLTKRGLGMHPVAFFDDDRNKWQWRVHNIPIVGSPEKLIRHPALFNLDEVIIAMPSAPAKRIVELVKFMRARQIRFKTVPSLDQLATGKVISQLREVDIADLLGREAVKLDFHDIRKYLEHRVVMVTGAGGSIGQELCRQIAKFKPLRLLLVEKSEYALFQIEQDMSELGFADIIEPLIADILDTQRMHYIFSKFTPSVVFHAAAHKHVPMMENQPTEALRNNTYGTARLADLARSHHVSRFIFISTDKAINPTNVMGASKRLAELYLQALQENGNGCTRFIAVRFGNVLGSSGSVIPIFKRQIAAGGPVKVTHPDINRFFMTIPEAVGLVLQSGAQGKGGEIFVLDMGKPIKIIDLARTLIELSGLEPDRDIEILFTGLRPGEKLFEELRHVGENLVSTSHPKILRLKAVPPSLNKVVAALNELDASLYTSDIKTIKLLLKKMIPEYQPYFGEACDDAPAPGSSSGKLGARDFQSVTSPVNGLDQAAHAAAMRVRKW